MDDGFSFTPTPKQADFVTNTAAFSCYSGGFGAGKTVAGCLRAIALSQYPNNRGLIGRYTYVELRNTTRKSFFELCPPEWYDSSQGGFWKPSENTLRLVNGSEILFMHLDTVSEKELLSLNLGWFFIDQAEEVSEEVFQVLVSRLRLNTVPNQYGFIVCNPEPGSWIYHKFKKPQEEGTLPADHYHMDASSYDNPYLPPDYIERMKSMYPEHMIRRYIYGDWDSAEGLVYSEFRKDVHVIRPFDVPKSWEFLISVDHGMVNPTAALLGAIDYDGNIYIIDEYYSPGVVSDHAKAIQKMTDGYDISFWLIDPSTRAKTREKNGMPWSILEEYEDHNLFFTPANNEVVGGINRVSEYFRVREDRISPVTGEKGAPKLFIFQNCVSLVEEIIQYKWSRLRGLVARNNPERPEDNRDHAMDALRYLVMSRFQSASKGKDKRLMIPKAQRKNMNDMASEVPEKYMGDDMLGTMYGNELYTPLSTDTYE